MNLFKSTFIRGLQCEKSLYFYKHHYNLKDTTPTSLQAVFDQGTNIGLLAQKLFPSCIFTEKFENFDFESCNNIFTPEIKSIMLATNVLKSSKNKKEVKNDLLSMMAPPILQSCSTTQFSISSHCS
jgi:hypothetical protein